jgi:hypothetical protein
VNVEEPWSKLKDLKLPLWTLERRPVAALLPGREFLSFESDLLIAATSALLMMESLHPYSILLMPPTSGCVLNRALQ